MVAQTYLSDVSAPARVDRQWRETRGNSAPCVPHPLATSAAAGNPRCGHRSGRASTWPRAVDNDWDAALRDIYK